jgi:hypothetical protein
VYEKIKQLNFEHFGQQAELLLSYSNKENHITS